MLTIPTTVMSIRITVADKEALTKLAADDGRTVSNYLIHYAIKPLLRK